MLRLYDDYLLSALIRQKAEQSLKRGEARINEEVSSHEPTLSAA
jgi:hypothetical protein